MVNRNAVLVGALIVLVVVVGVMRWRSAGAPTLVATGQGGRPPEIIPWINLGRLAATDRPEWPLGRRDPFKAGPPPPPPMSDHDARSGPDGGPEGSEAGEEPPPTPEPPMTPPPTPPPPPMNVKFIGRFEPKGQRKIAVLLTEQKEILHGHEGDTLAGRYKIVEIGLESTKVQDVTSGQTQTIPLRGN